MSYLYRGFSLNEYLEEPWYNTEQNLFQDILDFLPEKGDTWVQDGHYHNYIASSSNQAVIGLYVNTDGTLKASQYTTDGVAVFTGGDGTIDSSQSVDASYIGDGSVSNTEFSYLNGVTSNIQTQIDAINLDSIDAEQVSYDNSGYPSLSNVKLALDELLYVSPVVSLDITGVVTTEDGSVSSGSVPKGHTVEEIHTAWTINKDVTEQTIETISGQGGLLSTEVRDFDYTGLSITADTSVEIEVGDGTEIDTDTAYVRFTLGKYYGISSSSEPNESTIKSGTEVNSIDTSSSRTLSSTTIAGGGDYIYYAYPSAWGSVDLTVNGFATVWNETTVSVDNEEGNTENYRVYTSPNQITGSITLAATAA